MQKTYSSAFLRFICLYVKGNQSVYTVTLRENNLIVFYGFKQIHDFYLSDKDIEIIQKAKKKYAKRISI